MKKSGDFVIYAPSVHNGGGKILLQALILALPKKSLLIHDKRMIIESSVNLRLKYVFPTIFSRLMSELWLKFNTTKGDIVFCFGNLPPIFSLSAKVVVFVQNRYLVDDVSLNAFSINTKLKLQLERFLFNRNIKKVDEYIVQTQTMKRLLQEKLKCDSLKSIPIKVLPFFTCEANYKKHDNSQIETKVESISFVYVASGEPHKNHKVLIEAWKLLANDGLYPSLNLTLDISNFSELCSWIDQQVKTHHLQIENKGNLTQDQVALAYKNASALIYPSILESFGLPLVEARQVGLPVLASELDYVRDLLDPDQTFDPNSPISIARAVKRFVGIKDTPLTFNDANGFLNKLLE